MTTFRGSDTMENMSQEQMEAHIGRWKSCMNGLCSIWNLGRYLVT